MDEQQRLDEYLGWRQAQRKEQRARLYRRARVAGTVTALMLLTTVLAFAVAGWPRAAQRDVAQLPSPASAPAEPRVKPRRSVPPSPSASMSSAAAEPEIRNTPPEVLVQPPPAVTERRAPASAPPWVVVVNPPPAPTVVVEPPPTVVVERPARRAAAPVPAPAVATPQSPPAATEERMDTLKRLTGYIPEVWLARTVARWVKTQRPGETGPPTPERELPQTR